MKKLFLFALIGILSSSSFAQAKKGERTQQFTPAQLAALKVKQLALKLELNKNQQTKLSNLFEREIQSKQTAIEARKEQKSAEQTTDKDGLFKRKVAILDQKLAFQNEVKSILTEPQYNSWKKGQVRKNGKKFKRGQRGQLGRRGFSGMHHQENRAKFASKRRTMKRHAAQKGQMMKKGMQKRHKLQKELKEKKTEQAPKN